MTSIRNKILQLSHDVSQEARDDHGRWTSSGGSNKSNKSSGKKKTRKNKVTKQEKEKPIRWKDLTKTEKALAIGTIALPVGIIGAAEYNISRQSKPKKGGSSAKAISNDLQSIQDTIKRLRLRPTMNRMQRHYNRHKANQRNEAIKSGVKRIAKLGARKILTTGQLIRYHAQKAINRYSRPGKVVGLLTHVKLAHDVSNEARDKSGRWTSSGGSSKSKKAKRIVKTGAAVAVGTAGIVHAYNKHQENLHKKLNHRMLHRIIKTANSHGVIVNKEYLKNSKHSNEIIHDIKHIMNTYHDRGSLPKLSRQINVYEKFNTLPRKHKIGLARKLSKHFNLKSFAGRAKSIAAKFSSKLVSGLI